MSLYTGSTPGVNVSVIMRNHAGQILLGQRRSGRFAGAWGLPGGKVDRGETLLQAAIRETREETGCTPLELRLVAVSDILTNSAHFVNICFLAGSWEGALSEPEPQEIGSWSWYHLDQLPQPLYHNSAQSLEKFRQGRLY